MLTRGCMKEQYWIDSFYIDVSRNQITGNGHAQLLPPKAMAVLTYLAQNQGKVVSQEELLIQVWQGTIVSSNTLQRCIAQLRKALGDDGKVQEFIKTHAKRGYSLECNVRWQEYDDRVSIEQKSLLSDNEQQTNKRLPPIENIKIKSQVRPSFILLTTLTFIAVILATSLYWPSSAVHFSIKNITPITSTDNRELASIYSPNGEFMVFRRYPEILCKSRLWAKNIATQEEFELSKNLGSFGSVSFSVDGKSLAFVTEKDCEQVVTQKTCFQLQSLNFELALISPQTPTTLMECENSEIRSVKWVNNDEIALLQKHTTRWHLSSYSVSNNKSKTLYALDDGNIINYDYSPKHQLIALTSVQSDGRFYIETLRTDGEIISSYPIDYPPEIPKYKRINPNFSPIDDSLIFSSGKQLFTLSYSGKINNISLPLDEAIGSPVFHPNGKKMLAIKGRYDSDIVSVSLSQLAYQTSVLSEKVLDYLVLNRSTFGENNAKYQPNGDLVAYSSERSGRFQVWVSSADNNQQLSDFAVDTYIHELVWSGDGESILVNVSSQLKQIDLNGRETDIVLEHPIVKLFSWNSNQQTAIALVQIQGVSKFAELSLSDASVRVINDKRVKWAVLSENGQLIYMDYMEQFWQPSSAEDKLIMGLREQGSDKRFIIKDNTIYGINDNNQLWSYTLNNQVFNIIGKLPFNIDYISDINEQSLLFTMRIAARKDLVELTIN